MSKPAIAEPVLVTGATGFIGRRLCKRLLDDGVSVRALVLPSDPIPIEWGERVAVFRGDVSARSTLLGAFEGARTVFHLAAVVSDWGAAELHERITVRGTENVLSEAARHQARALLASSVVVYGDAIGRDVCDEEHRFGRPLGPYSRSKQEQERAAMRIEATQGLKVTIVRPTNVYGPGSVPWVDTVVEQLRAGGPMLIGRGDQIAGLAYVDNVVDLLVLAAASQAAVGRVYNACDDSRVTWRRYFSDLADLVGAPPPKSVPAWVAPLVARGLEGAHRALRRPGRPQVTREALNLVGSNHRVPIVRARTDLGFEPRVGYDEALHAIAGYLRQKQAAIGA